MKKQNSMNLASIYSHKRIMLLGAACLAALLTGCSGKKSQTVIKIDGSSTVFPVTEAVAEEFQKERRGTVQVTVGISGTGGGFKKFARGETDVQNASRPILTEEMAACKANGVQYIELPICFDALTVAVNPENDWCKSMTVAELKKLWQPEAQGKITKWNQIRPEWPDQPIKLFGAGSDSGTFDYFTEAIVGKAKSSRGDYTGSEDDNTLVQGIEGDKYALGYIPFAYFAPHATRMKAVAIHWEGKTEGPVQPSLDNVLTGKYNPLARPLFIYVNIKALERPEVAEMVEFYLKKGAELAKEVKYLPLPARAYEVGLDRLKTRTAGTAFGGVPEVGLPVEEILKREPRH